MPRSKRRTCNSFGNSFVTKPVLERELEGFGWLGELAVLVGVEREKIKLNVGTESLDEFARLGPTRAQLQRAAAVGVGADPHIVSSFAMVGIPTRFTTFHVERGMRARAQARRETHQAVQGLRTAA